MLVGEEIDEGSHGSINVLHSSCPAQSRQASAVMPQSEGTLNCIFHLYLQMYLLDMDSASVSLQSLSDLPSISGSALLLPALDDTAPEQEDSQDDVHRPAKRKREICNRDNEEEDEKERSFKRARHDPAFNFVDDDPAEFFRALRAFREAPKVVKIKLATGLEIEIQY